MAIFKCKICGGSLSINSNDKVAVCEYCGTAQTLPKLDDDKRVQLYDRANYFRRENEFDKAMGIYEMILSEDKEDYEAYWGIVLCRYGVQYVKDPKTSQRIPTVNRSQFTSIYDDEDFMNAIKYSDETQREIFKREAYIIDKIQKRILEISSKEEAFDIFICYKETDKNGNRTQDSVYAQDIYTALTKEGYKVFFSRITLEDKLGSAYEPYIFAALNSAKVMLVVGTEKDNFNAVWVKNEWSRYLSLIKAGKDKTLIPVYKDISPYDMPEEFAYLQSQDMSKIGYLQDLVYGVNKLINKNGTTQVKETVVLNNANNNTAPLLERVFMFLEDGDWASADEYCEKVLDLNPKCAEAYLGKLMVDLKVRRQDDLGKLQKRIDENSNFKKAYRFGNEKVKAKLTEYTKSIEEIRKDAILEGAKSKMIGDEISNYESALNLLKSISGWKDADECIILCKNRINEITIHAEQKKIAEEQENEQKRKDRIKRKKRITTILISVSSLVAVITAITILLTTIVIPRQKFNDIVSISAGAYHTVGLKSDGTVVAVGENTDGQCDVSDWYDIIAVSTGGHHTVGLKSDGTVVAVGDNQDRQCNTSEWTDIVAIYTGIFCTVGLKADGTVVATGRSNKGELSAVSSWTDIVDISIGYGYIVGLKSNGTVVSSGINSDNQLNDISLWTDIVAISSGYDHIVGLKSDGTVVAVGDNSNLKCNVSNFNDIIAISAGADHTVCLKSDGTVVAVGNNQTGKGNVEKWKDIIEISSGSQHTVGLKSDGTVVAIGENYSGQCLVGHKK